jgi:DNA-binding NarL/FixJ family response regulator
LTGIKASLAGSEPYTRKVLQAHPQLRVIARAGVGYDAVDCAAATEIGAAVAAILAGGIWLPEAASAAYLDESESALAAGIAELTPQQRRVLMLLTDGKSNKQIAFELAVTEATVKAHLSQIFRKLGVKSRTQAVISARRLTRVDPT